MQDKHNISFQLTDCPEESQLRAYHNGQLSRAEIRSIEEHLVDCEMCSDYLEGYSLLSGANELEKETAGIISNINSGNTKKNRLWLYATAASVFLGITLFSVIWFIPSKTNYVADKFRDINTLEKQSLLNDSLIAPSDGFIKDQSEVTTKNESTIDNRTIVSQTVVDQLSPIQLEVTEEQKQGDLSVAEYWAADKENENKLKTNEDAKSATAFTTIVQEKTVTETATGQTQAIAGGISYDRGLFKDETGKGEKKSNRKESKNKSDDADNNKVSLAEEAPASVSKADIPGKETDSPYSTESNQDLDKSQIFINQQMTDSAVVYALRATISCDSCKWTAMFALYKAYIASGQTEKAINTLKDIKAKAPAKYSKEAQAELKKLGY